MTAGPPESSPQVWTPSVPPANELLVNGNEGMTSSSTKRLRLTNRIGILLDKLRLTPVSAQLPEIDVRSPLIARAVIGSWEQHGCSKDHAL
jgi:hypothetical protein